MASTLVSKMLLGLRTTCLVGRARLSSAGIYAQMRDAIGKQERFEVRRNPALGALVMQVTSPVFEDEQAFAVYREMLEAPRPSHLPALREDEELKRKLGYRLGRVLMSLRRLTAALEGHLLNDAEKHRVLARAILADASYAAAGVADEETLQGLFSYYDDGGGDAVDDDDDDEEADSIPNNYSYLLNRSNADKKKNKKSSRTADELEALLISAGREAEPAEFSEDVLGSIEAEIGAQVEALRADFPDAERHVNRLRLAALKAWLSEYSDECVPAQPPDSLSDN